MKLFNIFKTLPILKEIKNSPFKELKRNYYFGKLNFGTPYMHPRNFLKYGLKITKDKPKYIRNNYFTLFGFYIFYGWPIYFYSFDLMWKDKFNSPRHEYSPAKYIYLFNRQFIIFYNSLDNNDLLYFEMFLWYKYYSNGDIEKAKKTWPWIDYDTKKNTWNDKYIK